MDFELILNARQTKILAAFILTQSLRLTAYHFENHRLRMKLKNAQGIVVVMVKQNRYLVDMLDENGIEPTEFDKIALGEMFEEFKKLEP